MIEDPAYTGKPKAQSTFPGNAKHQQLYDQRAPSDALSLQKVKAIQSHNRAMELVETGKDLFEQGNLVQALKCFNKAIQIQPNNQLSFYYINLISKTVTNRNLSPSNR